MVDHRECFLFQELPVIPDNPVDDTWLIFSPYLKKKIKVKGKEKFNNCLERKLTSLNDNFFKPNYSIENEPLLLELYITDELELISIKKSIIHSMNKYLNDNHSYLLINIVSDNVSTYINNITSVISIINDLTKGIVKAELVLSTKNCIDSGNMESLKKLNINLHFDVENNNPQEIFNAISKYPEGSDTTIRLFVNKNTVYGISEFVYQCIKYGVKKINIEPTKDENLKPIKEVFVLQLLKGIKISLENNIELLNSSYSNSFPVNILNSSKSKIKPEKCCKCFAKNICMSEGDFQCYVAQNTIPSFIKCH